MMKHRPIYYSAVLFLLVFGCSNPKSTHEHGNQDEIELNNGEKWKVVPEMMHHIQQIEKDVVQFKNLENTDYDALAEKIDSNLNLLTSNCTMKGKAHDELHKWLVPFIQFSNALSSENSNQARAKTIVEMTLSFNSFNTYFE